AAWGYNFDWQSRVLFAPKGTPAIVPTAFAARALVEASQAFREEIYLKTARSVCDFIIHDLQRSVETDTEVCFGYSPASSTTVYNASLLAAETLSSVASFTGESELSETAMRATRYVIRQQRDDGSWTYGAGPAQSWIDNFHTAFLLSSLSRIIHYSSTANTDEINESLRRGYGFWRGRFFLADGWPKYYDDTPYPADAHAAATAMATLSDLKQLDLNAPALAERVAEWSIENLHDRRGFFYYQRRRFYKVRTPFMRWSEAWMLYGLSRLLEERKNRGKG
ncbi:MAG: delta-aminolevulinic acid dehydratase, partial [Pyrinomonadaceae bacterium]